jgi:hypothetical protein
VLQHKTRDLYKEFYNWGEPGEIFDAVIQHVEDPDGDGRVTDFVYWDQTSQPGNLLYSASYPDDYAEVIPNRLSGNGYVPAVSSGTPLLVRQPYKDYSATSSVARVTESLFTDLSPQLLLEETAITIAGETVGFRERYHSFENEGVWGIITVDYVDETGAYTQEEEWMELGTRRILSARASIAAGASPSGYSLYMRSSIGRPTAWASISSGTAPRAARPATM